MCVTGCSLNRLIAARELAKKEKENAVMSEALREKFSSGFGCIIYMTVFCRPDSTWVTDYPCLVASRAVCAKWHADFKRYWLEYSGTTKVVIDESFPKITPAQVLQCTMEIGQAMSSVDFLCSEDASQDDKDNLHESIQRLLR